MIGRTVLAAPVRDDVAEQDVKLRQAQHHRFLLRKIAETLAGPRHDIEQSFLQMGEDLAACVKLLEEISSTHATLPAELASSEFATATQTLTDIRDQASALVLERNGDKDQIGVLAETVAEVERPMSDLRRSVRAISLIATNARIVTAGFGANNEDIAAFTSDMAILARTVNEAFGAFSRGYGRLMSLLDDARVANQAFISRHGATLSHILGTLEVQLDAINNHRKHAEILASERLERTGQIRTEVGKAIVSLQIGDITRQRVEHVEMALVMLQARPDAGVGPEALAAICHLQCSQLDEAIENFEAEVNEFAENIDRLGQHAAAVLREGNSEAEALLCNGGTALSVLVGDLHRICSLVDEFESALLDREKIIDHVTCSVTEMAGYLESVRTIERQIRMLSFNAAMQCCRVDEEEHGRALRAVARQLRELSGETITAANAIMGGLTRAEEQTKRLGEQRTSLVAHRVMSIKQGAVDAIEVFELIANHLREGAETVRMAGKRAERVFDVTGRRVADRQRISNAWREACSELRKLTLSPPTKPDPGTINVEILDQLRLQYTMEEERKLHDEFIGQDLELARCVRAEALSEGVEGMFL